MITKGIIRGKIIDSNKYYVEIPYLEQSSVKNNSVSQYVLEATLSHTPGIVNSYNNGDVVFVAFEDRKSDSPVILGKLLLDDANRGCANLNSLNVNGNVNLSGTVVIDGVEFEHLLSTIEHLKFKLSQCLSALDIEDNLDNYED